MSPGSRAKTILLADDDQDDQILCQRALKEIGLSGSLRSVENGQELLDYLKRGGKYADEAAAPCPDLILLDLNMPKKDGRSALKEIKSDPKLKRIPIVIFTTSNADTDICAAYDLGVNSFVAKPLSFKDLVEVMRVLSKYWFEVVELPDASTGC